MPPSEPPRASRSRPRRRVQPRKPPAPTPTQIRSALAQRAAYVSQGKAVERVANRQRAAQTVRRQQARSKPLAAKPMAHPRAGRPVRTQAHANQIVAAVNRQSRSVAADRARSVQAERNLRRAVSQTGGDFPRERRKPSRLEMAAHQRNLAQGFGIGLPVQVALNVARAVYQKPRIAAQVPGDLLKYAVGAPAGLVEAVAHPNQAIGMSVADVARRYGPVLKGDNQAVVDRLKREGITPELVDAAGVFGGTGAVAGRIAQRTAETGALGGRALRIATRRPDLQISGNVTRPQEVSRNLARNVVRGAVDARRASVQARRAQREDAPLEVRLAEERGAVTYTSRRRQGREQRKLIAQEKGAGVQRLKLVQQREHSAALKNLNSLSKDERRGYAIAHQFGATSPDAARRLLERRQTDIVAHREKLAGGGRDTPQESMGGSAAARYDREALADEIAQARGGRKSTYTVSKRRDQLPELQWLHQNAEKVFTPKLRKVVREEQARERRVAAGDPGVDLTQAQLRRYQPIAAALGIERKQGETHAQFLRRVNTAARSQGLERPGYLRSEERAKGVFSTMALGGRKATDIPKPYSGSLLRQGIESLDPNVHLQGVARGLKRRQQWNMVARNMERHAVDKLGGRSMRERDIVTATRDLENAGVDLGSVAFWNPRKFYEESRRAATDTQGVDLGAADAEDVLAGSGDVQRALQRSVVSPAEVRARPQDFASAKGFNVVPAAVLKELEGSIKSEGLVSRSVDISRGKISRVLLGNPAWLSFQVASNAFLTGLAGTGPIDALKAQRWWKGLSDAEREALAPELGITGWHDEQTRLGATANNHFVNAWRAFKQTGLYQRGHRLNPLDAIFKADNAQNNFFRKAVFYNQAKREAYRRMGDNASRMMRAQQGIQRVLKMDPQDRITEAAKNPKVFEHHARAVRDFLGDYTSYTAKERATLGRYAMFYGFLRHSLRLTFYTLPVKHPLMTAIGLELGKLHSEELRKIFGVDPPVWEQANAYIKSGSGYKKFAIGRLNPFFNAVQYQGPGSLLGLATPLASIALDQAAHQNIAFDQPWTVGGSGSYVMRSKDVTPAQRAKIAIAQALHLSPYVRLAEKTGIPGVAEPLRGKQTAESSIVFPDPVQYKPGEPAARNAVTVAEQEQVSARENAIRQLLPLFGEPAGPIIRKSQEYAASQGETVSGAGGGAPVSAADRQALRQAIRLGKAAARNPGASQEDLRRALRLAKAAAKGGG